MDMSHASGDSVLSQITLRARRQDRPMPLVFAVAGEGGLVVGRPIGPRPAISRPLPRRTRHLPRFSKPANGRLRPNGPPHNQAEPPVTVIEQWRNLDGTRE